MLIDDVKIEITAGHGGKGCASFNKNLMSLGPAGGSGGHGGNIIFQGVSDLNALGQFRYKKQISAPNGRDGKGQFCDGPDGKDLLVKIPVGTVIHNLDTEKDSEITKVGQEIVIAKGGQGGRGNFHFRSAKNTSPTEFEEGKAGEYFNLRLELKLIADVGFVGLPNVGKSSLLNEITNASAKVANYQFTTLEPNLGVHYGLILADIPGLIEGASTGKGLGIKFLKHVERTKIFFHFLSVESEDLVKDYDIIRKELQAYNPILLEKPEYIFISKTDMVSPAELEKKIKSLKKLSSHIIPISIHDWDSLQKVKDLLNEIEKEK
ncbi:MAG TPA: GTPase ObgE [Candidatus Moranbacteria bacterium]|nr:GTPase ObgE [Candidatus Moranbacteria bacterium]HRY27951.1 GTPase ObgE [Candidatus Moranbacteria bacterium]HSA08233.1 GTPase ObgE [Candidatus Moranbacteria bacterium]